MPNALERTTKRAAQCLQCHSFSLVCYKNTVESSGENQRLDKLFTLLFFTDVCLFPT